jgi:hypothetical protein
MVTNYLDSLNFDPVWCLIGLPEPANRSTSLIMEFCAPQLPVTRHTMRCL